jgi:hypothetical protein
MKYYTTAILILSVNFLFSQERKFEYYDSLAYDGYESFVLNKGRFIYQFSSGLSGGKTEGAISVVNDTLILNSDLQPFQEITESFNENLGEYFCVNVHNANYRADSLGSWLPYNIGFRLSTGKRDYDYIDLNLNQTDKVIIQNDSINDIRTYLFRYDLISRRRKLYFIVHRTNLKKELDIKANSMNLVDIVFNDLPDLMDYTFYTDQKAVFTDNGIVLIQNGKLEQTHYLYPSGRWFNWKKKNGRYIRASKKKIIKEYKQASNKT